MSEVAITGIGLVTPFGCGKSRLAQALAGGLPLPSACLDELNGTCLATQKIAIPTDLQAEQQKAGLPPRLMMYASAAGVLGCLAAKEAAEEAAIGVRFAPERVGLYGATGLTTASFHDTAGFLEGSKGPDGRFSTRRLGEAGLRALNPLESFKILPNMGPCLLSILLGIKGPNLIFSPWEEHGAAAIVEAISAVSSGEVDCALAGAADWPSSASSLIFLKQAGLIQETDVVSASAAYLVLERAEERRGGSRSAYGILTADLVNSRGDVGDDPLREALGRTFVVAPALLVAALCLRLTQSNAVVGVRGGRVSFRLRAWPEERHP